MNLTVIGGGGKSQPTIEQMAADINTAWEVEHTVDGGHANITPDAITLNTLPLGVWTNLRYDSARFFANGASVWTVSADDQRVFRYCLIGQLCIIQFAFYGTAISGDTSVFLAVRIPELHFIAEEDTGSPGFPLTVVNGFASVQDITGFNGGMVFTRAESFTGATPSTVLYVEAWPGSPTGSEFGIGAVDVTGVVIGAIEPKNIATRFFG